MCKVQPETEKWFERGNQEQGHFHKGPAEGAIGSNVIIAFVAGVMVTAQKS